jgi:hypothetical protein
MACDWCALSAHDGEETCWACGERVQGRQLSDDEYERHVAKAILDIATYGRVDDGRNDSKANAAPGGAQESRPSGGTREGVRVMREDNRERIKLGAGKLWRLSLRRALSLLF